MPTMKLRLGVSPAWGLAVAGAMAGALGLTTGGLQAAPKSPDGPAVSDRAPPDMLRNCGADGRDVERFELERARGGIRTIDICDAQERRDLSPTAQALSVAIDAAPPPSRITSDPRTLDILNLQLTRARTEMNPRLDADARNRKLTEIDNAIKKFENEISEAR